jgi:hypothetical protein
MIRIAHRRTHDGKPIDGGARRAPSSDVLPYWKTAAAPAASAKKKDPSLRPFRQRPRKIRTSDLSAQMSPEPAATLLMRRIPPVLVCRR